LVVLQGVALFSTSTSVYLLLSATKTAAAATALVWLFYKLLLYHQQVRAPIWLFYKAFLYCQQVQAPISYFQQLYGQQQQQLQYEFGGFASLCVVEYDHKSYLLLLTTHTAPTSAIVRVWWICKSLLY